MKESTDTAHVLNPERIAAICHQEWQAFLDHFSHQFTPRQMFRSFLINWVAVFFPEAIYPTLRSEMSNWMDRH